MSSSLQKTWLAILLLFALLPMLAVGGVLSWMGSDLQVRQVLSIQDQIALRSEALLANFVEEALMEMNILVRSPGFVSGSTDQQLELLARTIFDRNLFDSLTVIDNTGMERLRVARIGITPPDQPASRASDPLFRSAIGAERPVVAALRFNPVSRELSLPIALPYLLPGNPPQVLIAEARMNRVIEQVVNIPVGLRGSVSLLEMSGRVIAHRNRDLIGRTVALSDLSNEHQTLADADGIMVLMTLRTFEIGDYSLGIAVAQPLDEVYQPVIQNILLIATLIALMTLAAVAGSISIVQTITRPIQALARMTEAIGAGDFAQRIPATRNDEIGTLQRNFNRMVENIVAQQTTIAARNEELEQSLQEQRRLFETVQQLSIPLLPVWEGVIVLPIVGHVDAQRGQALLDALLKGIAERHARVAILDITGIAVVDPTVIAILMRAMQAAALLGATPMLAGISAAHAHLMVQQGIADLNVATFRNLKSAIAAAIEYDRMDGRSKVRARSEHATDR
ncbi:MAG: HAMP domain-containing protein [Roseiflexus sp.]